MPDAAVSLHDLVVELDLPEIAAYIMQDNPVAAERVITTIRATFKLLASQPKLGVLYRTRNRKLKGLRMSPVQPYRNYLIFYRPMPQGRGVRILYVLHAARDIAAILDEEPRD